jgi:anti-anti-sigma factor
MFDYERRVNTCAMPCPRSDTLPRHIVSSPLPEPFRCDVETLHGKVHVRPHGEIDIASAPLLESSLRELRETGFDHLVLDLREVTFLDSTGLRTILGWDDVARREGLDFELIPGPAAVQRLFSITGVRDRLRFVAPPA